MYILMHVTDIWFLPIPEFQVSGDSERIVDIDANPWYVQLGTGPLDNYGNIDHHDDKGQTEAINL